MNHSSTFLFVSSAYFWRPRWRLSGLLLLWLLALTPAWGQTDSLSAVSEKLTRYGQRVPTEKLFLHLDRPSYVSGESLWFKIYAVEGKTQRPLTVSSVAYVEVLDGDNQPVGQAKIAMRQAVGYGSLVLPATLASGRYTVRAYTSWMKNFGPELYFHTSIRVVNTRTPLAVPTTRAPLTYDPQFFPEGGYLVQGLRSKVGFKVTDSQGKSVAAEGQVVDQNGTSVAQFKTLRFGMGSFSFTPTKAGLAYKVIIKLANQQTISCKLPLVQERGYVLMLTEASPTQLRLEVQTQGVVADNIFLLGHAQQQVSVAVAAPLRDGKAVFMLDKQQLAAGISHFTLFNSRRQPVGERLYFRPPGPGLSISVGSEKSQYEPREKVSLSLSAASSTGQSIPANVSVAVYQLDSLSTAGGADITSYLALSSDLKGEVEGPAYYFTATSGEVVEATDNLMLTQGWSRFHWAEILADKTDSLAYAPEVNGPLLQGRVVNSVTGAPMADIPVYLAAPSRHIQLYASASKRDGSILFELGNNFYGLKSLIIQPNLSRDSLCRVELSNPFSTQYAARPTGHFALAEQWAGSLRLRHVQAEVQRRYFGAVPVRYQAPHTDSIAFYGKPDEHYRLDDYTRFKVMEEVMREYVPGVLVRARRDGFHFLVPDNNAHTLSDNPLVLLDGVPVFNVNKIMAFDPLKVRQLDVVTTRYFLGPLLHDGVVSYSTYTGDLAGFPLDARALLQEYEGLQGQRDFYAPRYDTPQQKQSRLPDFRNLLYWNPEIIVGTDAQPTFYTSDQAGTYRVVVQGLTETGLAGNASFTFTVKAAL